MLGSFLLRKERNKGATGSQAFLKYVQPSRRRSFRAQNLTRIRVGRFSYALAVLIYAKVAISKNKSHNWPLICLSSNSDIKRFEELFKFCFANQKIKNR